jgi:PAS domain-containing protein/DNA-binding NarL/FixJ family response regulator
VVDIERDLADCVGAVYEAAASNGDWLEAGARIRRLLDARRGALFLEDRSGALRNVLAVPDPGEAAYAAHFGSLNPYAARAARDFADARVHHVATAKVGAELVPDETFLRSEYYFDFARRYERRHMVGGVLGISQVVPLGFFRGDDADPFGEREVRLLKALLPHVQRALELRARLSRDDETVSLTRAALDALPVSVVIVDGGLKIRFANGRAQRMLGAPGVAVYCVRPGPHAGAGAYLAARSRDETAALRRLVVSAISGGTGGALRIGAGAGSPVAVLVSPTPPSLADDAAGSPTSKLTAMIAIRPLQQRASPSTDMLCDLFGLSRAEAEVALALGGGASADDVARRRHVSLPTVRSQIRAILGKSESENLRDFERSMATLAALVPSGGDAARG